jgi:hypothetical protein
VLGHLLPRGQPIRCEPAHGEHQLTSTNDVFKSRAAITERARGQGAAVAVQQVERHVDGRRRDGGSVWLAQPVEARAKLLVEDRRLAVEDQRPRRQRPDRSCEIAEALRAIDAVAAD